MGAKQEIYEALRKLHPGSSWKLWRGRGPKGSNWGWHAMRTDRFEKSESIWLGQNVDESLAYIGGLMAVRKIQH